MSSERRPPMTIKAMEEKLAERKKPEQGELSYVTSSKEEGEEKGEGVGEEKKKKSLFNLGSKSVQTLIPIVVSLLLMSFMMVNFAPTKGQLGALVERIDSIGAIMEGQKALVAKNTERIETMAGTLGTLPKKSYVDSRVAGIVDFSTDIKAVKGSIEVLEVRVGKVEVKGGASSLSYTLYKEGQVLKLRVVSGTSGSYVGKVTLSYSPSRDLGGVTYEEGLSYFYLHLSSPSRYYKPSLVKDDRWKLAQVEFLTGSFSLVANQEITLEIPMSGYEYFLSYSGAFIEVGTSVSPGGVSGGSI